MNTAALLPGRRLRGRKPRQAQPSESASTSTARFGCSVVASITKYAQAIVASDAARPSMLSSRLKAFVMPTSQMTATATARTSLPITSTRSPLPTTIAAAPNCAASLASGGRWRTSSTRPAAKSSAQPPRIPQSSPLPVHRGDGESEPGPGNEAREDADAAEGRCRPVVPAFAGRQRDEPSGRRRSAGAPSGGGRRREPRRSRRPRSQRDARPADGSPGSSPAGHRERVDVRPAAYPVSALVGLR